MVSWRYWSWSGKRGAWGSLLFPDLASPARSVATCSLPYLRGRFVPLIRGHGRGVAVRGDLGLKVSELVFVVGLVGLLKGHEAQDAR